MLNKRDIQRARKSGRIPSAFLGEDELDEGDFISKLPRRSRHRNAEGDEFDGYDPNTLVNFTDL